MLPPSSPGAHWLPATCTASRLAPLHSAHLQEARRHWPTTTLCTNHHIMHHAHSNASLSRSAHLSMHPHVSAACGKHGSWSL